MYFFKQNVPMRVVSMEAIDLMVFNIMNFFNCEKQNKAKYVIL